GGVGHVLALGGGFLAVRHATAMATPAAAAATTPLTPLACRLAAFGTGCRVGGKLRLGGFAFLAGLRLSLLRLAFLAGGDAGLLRLGPPVAIATTTAPTATAATGLAVRLSLPLDRFAAR